MNKESYDNFMTTFKKNLWEMCIKEKIFENIDNSKFEKVKKIFEDNIENHKTHILQTNGDANITNVLLSNIKNEIKIINRVPETREDLSNERKEQFDSEYQKKQKEFNLLLNNEKPKDVNFSDDAQDSPLEADNLEALIQEQMKDRELHMPKQSDETNTIVSDNKFTKLSVIESAQIQTEQIPNSKLESLLNQNQFLVSEIAKLRQQINSQNDAIHKILSSQILVLKKLQ